MARVTSLAGVASATSNLLRFVWVPVEMPLDACLHDYRAFAKLKKHINIV